MTMGVRVQVAPSIAAVVKQGTSWPTRPAAKVVYYAGDSTPPDWRDYDRWKDTT